MKITGDIRDAIELAATCLGGTGCLAALCRIDREYIKNWMIGSDIEISDDNWTKLAPHLTPYMGTSARTFFREALTPPPVLDVPYSARIADALESIARSLELIANPASVLDTKTGKATPASRNPGSICEM